MQNIEQEMNETKLRNQRVEADKAGETSNFREVAIAISPIFYDHVLHYPRYR